jgi:hypothetical protein
LPAFRRDAGLTTALRTAGEFGLTRAGTALVNVLLPVIHPRMGTPSSAAADRPLLAPPGFMMLNHGRRTPLATIVAHVAYGMIVGGFISLAA